MKWYKKWSKDEINTYDEKDLVIQCLRNIQGTKDAGNDWYNLLSGLFLNIVMIRRSSDHGFYSWTFTGDEVYKVQRPCQSLIGLATDDILILTNNKILYDRLQYEFKNLFKFTSQDSEVIKLLNFVIIQREIVISMDQTSHIKNEILDPYWRGINKEKIRWCGSPFPV